MKISFLGDSITAGCGATEYKKCYVALLGDKYGFEAKNFGIGGTRISRQKEKSENEIYDRDFVGRVDGIDKDSDFVFVFGGTNDSWADAPLGDMKFSDWKEQDLYNVLPAICYFLHGLRADLPRAEILCVINTDIKSEIADCIEKNAIRYGFKTVSLHDIDKVNDHPTVKGMTEICEQIISVI